MQIDPQPAAKPPVRTFWQDLGPRLMVATLRVLHVLPMGALSVLGRMVGIVLHAFAHERRAIARRNIELCFPSWTSPQRNALLRQHFELLGRSLVDYALLWFASDQRLRQRIEIQGDPTLAERSSRPVMWLVPHFVGLEVAGAAVQLFQSRTAIDIYKPQRSPYFDRVLKRGRLRFGRSEAYPRSVPIRHLIKRIREGCPFFNMPDQDFGARDSVFVPFFGVPAATLTAPSKMARMLDMVVQPVVVQILPGGQGWRVSFLEPLQNWPTDDPHADAQRMNAFIEQWVRECPAQYLWVHKRFKTRPPGEPSPYEGIR